MKTMRKQRSSGTGITQEHRQIRRDHKALLFPT